MVDDYFWGAMLFSAQFSSDLLASGIFDNVLHSDVKFPSDLLAI
jgi:hypothetical protein